MPQYVMCLKHNCPKVKECYRYLAVPDKDQLYNEFINMCSEKDEFRYFMKVRPEDKIISLELEEIEQKNENEAEIPKNKA